MLWDQSLTIIYVLICRKSRRLDIIYREDNYNAGTYGILFYIPNIPQNFILDTVIG